MPSIATGLRISIANTPQAQDDVSGGLEDFAQLLDVLYNDLGGAAKTLYALSRERTYEDGGTVTAASMIGGLPLQTITTYEGATATIVNGKISYDTNGALDHLGAGETATDIFSYIIRLASGAFSIATVTINLAGSNDDVVITDAIVEGSVTEDLVAATSGTIDFDDVDVNDLHSASFVAVGGVTPLGTFALDPVSEAAGATDGSVGWSYTINDSLTQHLRAGQVVTETYRVTIADDSGAANSSVTRDVTITITGTNDGPVLSDTVDPGEVVEAGAASAQNLLAISGSFSVSDLDVGDTLEASQVGDPAVALNGEAIALPDGASALIAAGAFSLTNTVSNGGSASIGYSYDPGAANLDFLGAGDSLTITYAVRVNDGIADSAIQNVTITVTGTNDGPVAVADTGSAGENEGKAFAVVGNDSDVDHGAVLSLTSLGAVTVDGNPATPAEAGAFTRVGNSVQFTPGTAFDHLGLGDSAEVEVSYTITDEHGASSNSTLTITVTGTNDLPEAAAAGSVETDEDTVSLAVAIGATDVDGDSLSYSVKAGAEPALGSVSFDQAAGTFTYTPALNANGADSFTIVIADGRGGTAEQVVSVMINPVNDAPEAAAAGSVETDEDTVSLAVAIGATDVDGDSLSYSVKAGAEPASGSVSFDQAAGTFTYTPALNANGADSFTIVIADGHGGTAEQVVSVMINPVNDAPEAAAAGSVETDEDTVSLAVAIGATDVDGDSLTYSVKAGAEPASGSVSFDAAAGTFTYTPALNANGADSFTIVIADGRGGTAEQVVSVTINPVNDLPEAAAAGSVETDEDTVSLAVAIGATDVDGDSLTYSVKAGAEPASGSVSFDAAAGTFTYTPALNANGADSFTIVIADGHGGTAEQVVSVTINPVNDLPEAAAAGSVETDEDTVSLAVAIGATDVDGDSLSYSVKAGAEPALGSVSFDAAAGTFTYTPALNANGADSFTIVISDGNGGTAEQVVSVTINPVNDLPEAAAAGSVETDEDTVSLAVAIGATDVDGDSLSYSVKAGAEPALGSVSFDAAAGTFTYTPALNANGADSFTIVISDGHGGTAEQVVSVTINPVNDAPSAVNDEASGDEDSLLSGDVSTNDIDPDVGDVHGYASEHVAGFEMAADGSWTFDTADAAYQHIAAGEYEDVVVGYVVADLAGETDDATLTVRVYGVNDAPVVDEAIADQETGDDEDWEFTIPQGSFSDIDGDMLTYQAMLAGGGSLPSWLSFNPATLTFTGTPPIGAAMLNITVTASDGEYSVSDTFTLEIEHVVNETRVNSVADDQNFDNPSLIAAFATATARAGDFDGGGGADTILGSSAAQELNGQGGADTIHGAGGDDEITGGGSNDKLYGGEGSDLISGDGGDDEIYGGSGNDTITGVGGIESIRGGSGDDAINGGGQADQLWGGTGQDDFIFTLAGDSSLASRDRINDFSNAEGDIIDLSAFALLTPASFVGQVASSAAIGAGQVGYVVNLDGTLTVFAETNGVGGADLAIDLLGVGSLQGANFLL